MSRFKVLITFLTLCAFLPSGAQATGFADPSSRVSSAGGTGDFGPVEPEIEGGDVSIGSTAQVVILFRNDSGRPIETGAIQLYPSSTVSANVTLNQCSNEPLPAGATCAVAVSVKGLQAGAWRIEMIMRHSGRSRLTRATLSGQVDAGEGAADRFISDVEAIPEELDFGTLDTSQPLIRSVVVRNITSESIDIDAIYIEAAEQAGYSLRTDCSSLDPGQACIVVVTWSPVLKGQATGVLLVEHSGPTRVASVNLDGIYEPETAEPAETFPEAVPGKGLLVASQDSIDFGADINTTSAITVSLVNIGDAPLKIEDLRLANSDNGLSISGRGCGELGVLQPVEACPLTVTWSPVRAGAILDDIQVIHNGARGILVLPVRGTATSIISQDTRAVRLSGAVRPAGVPQDGVTGSAGDAGAAGDPQFRRDDGVDPGSVLDGFIVTSHASTRAIINGPGGSRIVFDGEEVVIGGFLWDVNIRRSGVEFRSGNETVLLLFDRSLSSVNRNTAQSGGNAGSGGSGNDE